MPVDHSAAPGVRAAGASRRAVPHLGALGDSSARKQDTKGIPMRFRLLILSCAALMSVQSIAAQTIGERVASLEVQVAELWRLHEHAFAPGTTVPAELIGNEHLRWGNPGWGLRCAHERLFHHVPRQRPPRSGMSRLSPDRRVRTRLLGKESMAHDSVCGSPRRSRRRSSAMNSTPFGKRTN